LLEYVESKIEKVKNDLDSTIKKIQDSKNVNLSNEIEKAYRSARWSFEQIKEEVSPRDNSTRLLRHIAFYDVDWPRFCRHHFMRLN
jgi:vacuolar-type H+-ATPase subunit E/Vma4